VNTDRLTELDVIPPSVAVTVTVPLVTPVACPPTIVATAVLLVPHTAPDVQFAVVELANVQVAVKFVTSPVPTVAEEGVTAMLVSAGPVEVSTAPTVRGKTRGANAPVFTTNSKRGCMEAASPVNTVPAPISGELAMGASVVESMGCVAVVR
jgi:hypothetical protein